MIAECEFLKRSRTSRSTTFELPLLGSPAAVHFLPRTPMNTQSPIGQQRTLPNTCEIGDWIPASDIPEWETDYCHDRPFLGDHRAGLKVFKLFPSVDGKLQQVWIRIG